MSERSGLPASSIYWHFTDKDELIAAVIDRSYHDWIQAWDQLDPAPDSETREQAFHADMWQIGKELAGFPDFLRLGLMLVLEHRPQEPSARRKFIEVRHNTIGRIQAFYEASFGQLNAADVRSLVVLTVAMADGFFIAQEAEGVDLGEAFDVMATAILGAADLMSKPG